MVVFFFVFMCKTPQPTGFGHVELLFTVEPPTTGTPVVDIDYLILSYSSDINLILLNDIHTIHTISGNFISHSYIDMVLHHIIWATSSHTII